MQIRTLQTYTKGEGDLLVLVSEETYEADIPTTEELIEQKQTEMLALYNEIEKLKNA